VLLGVEPRSVPHNIMHPWPRRWAWWVRRGSVLIVYTVPLKRFASSTLSETYGFAARGGLSLLDESATFARNRASKRFPQAQRTQEHTQIVFTHHMFSNFLDAFLRPLRIPLAWVIPLSTAELGCALESGHVTFEHAARAERYQSDPGNDTSSDPEGGAGDSESSSSFSFQPKSRAGSHSPQPRPLQESSRTRCMVLT